MKKILQFLLGTAMVAAAVLSCKKDEIKQDEIKQETLEVSPSEDLQFLAKGNKDAVLTISTNASTYEVDAEEWVLTQKDGNKLSVNVTDNESAGRSCDMTISAGTAEPVVIKITQTGKPAPVNGQLADQTSTDDPVRVTMEQGAAAYTVTPVLKLASALEDAGSMTLSYDETGVDNWNSLDGVPVCEKLPENSYTLPEGGFTIPAGQTDVPLPIEINLENLEYETSYMLVLKVQAKSDNIGDVSCGNDGLRYIITTAKEPAKPVDHSTRKNVAILEVNDVNPLSLLEVKFTDGSLFFDGVVLFSSNIQYNADGNYVELYHNPNVQTLLEQRDTYIKPLQDAGIEVYLSILGNHTPAWVSNLLPATAEGFAAEVAAAVSEYHLDGVFLDDEYRGTYSKGEYTDLFYPYSTYYGNLEPQYSEFGYFLKQALKTLAWNPKVILYQVNEEEWREVYGTPVNEYLDLLIPDHNGTAHTRP